VALPGETMRARHGLAILNRVGLTDLIARDKDDYVAIAARLGRDADLRRQIGARVAANKSALYGDRAPLDAFASWLDHVARDER
jgi:predicted O-linked N-acetylglucosamine transferase (SPINDLY family)